jgi:hypothetical protein
LLHDGQFDAAERRTRPAAASGDLSDQFLDAFVYYWRLLYDDKNPTLQAAFDTRLTRTISLAQTRLGKDPKDAEAAVLGGTAHVLRTQLLGRQKKAMAAANEAKRGRRILLQTQDPDALFGPGSRNYPSTSSGAPRAESAGRDGIPAGDREEGSPAARACRPRGKAFRPRGAAAPDVRLRREARAPASMPPRARRSGSFPSTATPSSPSTRRRARSC